jgi:alpha-1,2-mannosyltransferase
MVTSWLQITCGLEKAVDMVCRRLTQGRDILDTKIKRTAVSLAFLTVIVLGVLMVNRAAFSTGHNSDFMTYRAAGWSVLTGSDIYEAQNSHGWPYVYPPPFAILMTPFAELSAFTGSIIWYLLSVILVVSSVQMCVTMVLAWSGFRRNPFWLYVLSPVMVLLWVGQGAVEGQATILTLWLLIVALYQSQRGKDIAGGTALACAALLKAFPLALLTYFAWKKRWRFGMATVTALIVGGIALPALVYGWQRNLTYWQEWVATVGEPSLVDEALRVQSQLAKPVLSLDNSQNQALRAVLWRLGAKRQARFLAAGVGLMMLLVMLLLARRTQSQGDLLTAAAWLAWILVIAPVSHFHYHMLVLWPMTVLAFLALVKTDSLLTTSARVTLVVYLLASVCTLALPYLQYIGLLCWTTLGLWTVLLFVAVRYDTHPAFSTTGVNSQSKAVVRRQVPSRWEVTINSMAVGFPAKPFSIAV